MNCDEARLLVQALFDKELDGPEAEKVISHLESCYHCRKEYTDLLRLEAKMKGLSYPEPSVEWFEELSSRRWRRKSSFLGYFLFFASYLVLLFYALFTLITDPAQSIIMRVAVAGLSSGLLVLFFIVVQDRFRERKQENGRYKEVMK